MNARGRRLHRRAALRMFLGKRVAVRYSGNTEAVVVGPAGGCGGTTYLMVEHSGGRRYAESVLNLRLLED